MKLALAAVSLLVALPAAAQMPPPPRLEMIPDAPGRPPLRGMARMFGSMSDTGRATMLAAIRNGSARSEHQANKLARDRMLAVLDADRLDPVALKRAMDDEREAAIAAKVSQQAALLGAFQQLSLADRRAFVADTRALRERVEGRMTPMKAQRRERGGMIPPPPQ